MVTISREGGRLSVTGHAGRRDLCGLLSGAVEVLVRTLREAGEPDRARLTLGELTVAGASTTAGRVALEAFWSYCAFLAVAYPDAFTVQGGTT